jgi:GMP synthase (glutamine-hydrolysing)
MGVELVFTERRRDLTAARARNYDRLRERLASASGDAVAVSFYEEAEAARLAAARAVVLSGSSAPWSSHDEDALERLRSAVLASGRPVLGICAGMQLQARFAGGTIRASARPEHGFVVVERLDGSDLLRGLPERAAVFQDHTDEIAGLPDGFRVLARSADCPIQAVSCPELRWWGTQFHPEESTPEHPEGARVLRTFFELAGR